MTLAARPLVAAVNHLLAREEWARTRLVAYAGRTAQVAVPPVTLALQVQPDGYFAVYGATSDKEPDTAAGAIPAPARLAVSGADTASAPSAPVTYDVSIALAEGAVAAFLRGGQSAVMKHVRIEGDAEFAAELAKLAEHLRWEPEEDLARLIGDAPAYRAATFARGAIAQINRTGRNLFGSLVEYWLDEDPQLVRREALADLGAGLVDTRDALARIEKRIERLEARRRGQAVR